MATNIQWTDETWNPTTGCTKVSPGCVNCYIERTPPFRMAGRRFVKGKIPVELHADKLDKPLHWRKPRRVFVNSLSDLFHEDIPGGFIHRVWLTMQKAHRERGHIFQVLTKRPERLYRFLREGPPNGIGWYAKDGDVPYPERGIWLGVSVEDRKRKERIDVLRKVPADVRFLSCEPLVEDLGTLDLKGINWVIAGGESGPRSRPCDIAWIRSIVEQCKASGVPVFVKQLGARPFDGELIHAEDEGNALELSDKKGGDIEEFPADLRLRQFPTLTP